MERHYLEIGTTLALVVITVIFRWVIVKSINAYAGRLELGRVRVIMVSKMTDLFLTIIFLTICGFIWNLSIQGLSLYFASFFTVAGIALFASWSILSNITASMILFFYFPHKLGSKIRVLDGDNTVEGRIMDITLFTIQIETAEGYHVIMPNNLFLQKTTMKMD